MLRRWGAASCESLCSADWPLQELSCGAAATVRFLSAALPSRLHRSSAHSAASWPLDVSESRGARSGTLASRGRMNRRVSVMPRDFTRADNKAADRRVNLCADWACKKIPTFEHCGSSIH